MLEQVRSDSGDVFFQGVRKVVFVSGWWIWIVALWMRSCWVCLCRLCGPPLLFQRTQHSNCTIWNSKIKKKKKDRGIQINSNSFLSCELNVFFTEFCQLAQNVWRTQEVKQTQQNEKIQFSHYLLTPAPIWRWTRFRSFTAKKHCGVLLKDGSS